jgi:hypothetical protein
MIAEKLTQYIMQVENKANYPEIVNVYEEHEKTNDECFLLLEENEADFIDAGNCKKKPVEQTCDIGLVLKFGTRSEEETITLIDNIASRFLAILQQDLTLYSELLSGRIEKEQKSRFNDFGSKARCVMWSFIGKFWS